jgi:hypothetical protein
MRFKARFKMYSELYPEVLFEMLDEAAAYDMVGVELCSEAMEQGTAYSVDVSPEGDRVMELVIQSEDAPDVVRHQCEKHGAEAFDYDFEVELLEFCAL